MAKVVIMPKLGFNMNEGKLVEWYKSEGDSIAKGEPLFSVETDKTNMDIEATDDGIVRKLFISEGDTVPVTVPIAIIAAADENIDALVSESLAQLGGDAPAAEKKEATAAASEQKKEGSADTGEYDYDIAVIGGGPGGYVAAIKAAQMGKKTVIIEKEHFGGTCLNVGCIPTKALLRSAEALNEVKECAAFGVVGVDNKDAALDLAKVQERKKGIVAQLVGGVQGLLKKNGAVIENGEGILEDAHTVKVGGKKITAANIIIATGSQAKMLPIPVAPEMTVMTSTEVLDIDKAPEKVVVIGGGVIGIEFAYFLSCIGVKVAVVEFLDRILPMVDEEITEQVVANLKGKGIEIYTSAQVTEITADAVVFKKDGKTESVACDQVLMAVGRGPSLEGIDTEKLGIKTEKGAIVTDKTLKTSAPGVYAIGDVNGKAMLAHTASMEAIIAVKNICGEKAEMDYGKIPSAIYIKPEIASVGLTERQAREQYKEIKVGRFPLIGNGKAKVEGEDNGMVKVITDAKYGEILGVHMYCIHATDMIAESAVAMRLEATAEEIAMSIHPHPTVSEVIHEAMHAAADGKAIHI